MRPTDGVLKEGARRVHLCVANLAVPPAVGDLRGATATADAHAVQADANTQVNATTTGAVTVTATSVPPRWSCRSHGTGVMGARSDDLARVRPAMVVFRPRYWPADRHVADTALVVAGEEARGRGGERGRGGGIRGHAHVAKAADAANTTNETNAADTTDETDAAGAAAGDLGKRYSPEALTTSTATRRGTGGCGVRAWQGHASSAASMARG